MNNLASVVFCCVFFLSVDPDIFHAVESPRQRNYSGLGVLMHETNEHGGSISSCDRKSVCEANVFANTVSERLYFLRARKKHESRGDVVEYFRFRPDVLPLTASCEPVRL